MKTMKMFLAVLFMSVIVLGVVTGASALTITPAATIEGDMSYVDVTGEQWSGWRGDTNAGWDTTKAWPDTNPQDAADIAHITGTNFTGLTLLSGGASDATTLSITSDLSGPTTGAAYLLIKDGVSLNDHPAFYVFNVTGWNGTEDITVSPLWPANGAISHWQLMGNTTSVPEPTTMLLLGFGLVGLAGVGRKFKK